MKLTQWNKKLDKLDPDYTVKFGKPLWGPHPTCHYKVVCLREHTLEDGTRRSKGETINFFLPHMRDAWLASQHPRAWGKLLKRWGKQ